jgi:putative hemolysin
MEILVIVGLIVLNGLLSMAEIGVLSSRRNRLESAARKGSHSARKALELSQSPDRFLSTIQIGITFVGLLTGVFSGAQVSDDLGAYLARVPFLAPYAQSLGLILVIVVVTYFTLVFGELVPKRIGMNYPETVAKIMAGPMTFLATAGKPIVGLLSVSTRFFSRLFGVNLPEDTKVTEEEIKAIIQEGTDDGEIQVVEQDIVERVFNLGDRDVESLMTHRNDLVKLHENDTTGTILQTVRNELHDVYPVLSGQSDHFVGVVFLKDMFGTITRKDFSLKDLIRPAQFIPESMSAYNALELMKQTRVHYALVTDEFGVVQGMVTIIDIMDAIVGNITASENSDFSILQREDHTWLIDGQYSFYDFLSHFDREDLYQEHDFNTLSGLILDLMERIPNPGDKVEWMDFTFEIMDMDGARIDKILATYAPKNV